MRTDFIVFKANQRLRNLQRYFEDMVNASSVAACGALGVLHFVSDRREALGQISFDRKPLWAVLT
jgi:hypothetical protein